jgi:8-oxo-dGTP diphosphatase
MITCKFEDGNSALLRHVVVDALVIKNDKILLVKRTKKLLEGGKWALVGGYMDRDENTRQTLVREVHEETGWTVSNIKLFRINDNPDRRNEDRQNVSFVYVCKAVKKTGNADWESDERRWFDLRSIPPPEKMAFDHIDNIRLYLKYLEKSVPLPFIG